MNFINIFSLLPSGWLLIVGPGMSRTINGEKWRAVTDAAISITGDIVFFKDRIVFQNGKFVEISFLRTAHGFIKEAGEEKDADVYRVITKNNPILLNANTLCGRDVVTYIAISDADKVYDDDVKPKGIQIFTGKSEPKSDNDLSYCGGFSYDAN